LCNARHIAEKPTPGENQSGHSAESLGKSVTNAFAGVGENLIGTIPVMKIQVFWGVTPYLLVNDE